MTPRETLAAYAVKIGIWLPMEHVSSLSSTEPICTNCGLELGTGERTNPCPGPDYTQNTDVLLRIFQALGLRGRYWTPLFWQLANDGSSDISRFKEALLAAVLAGIEALEVGE